MASAQFDETVNLLKSGTENIAPQAATRNIEGWLTYLAEHKSEETAAVRASLKELKNHLSAGGPDSGSSLGALLAKLSRETLHVANSGSPSNSSSVQEIGEALVGR